VKGIVEQLRTLLKQYDEGLCTEGEVGAVLIRKLVDEHVERATKGEESGWFTSVCGGEDVPPIRCIIEIGPGKPAWFKPLAPLEARLVSAEAAFRFYRAIPQIPPGKGGSTVPFMRAVDEFEAMADAWLGVGAKAPSDDEKVWGVFVYGFHGDAIVPPADSPKWDQPGGVGYKDVSFSHTWRGTKVEAQARVDEMNRDPARRLLGFSRVVAPIPRNER